MKLSPAILVLLLASLACRPVITVGWEEILFVLVLFAILIGPPVYRFFRRLEDFRRHERERDKAKKE